MAALVKESLAKIGIKVGVVALERGTYATRSTNPEPEDALNLGVGHWRPREHDPEAGRQLVEAAIETGRHGEARRHLEAMAAHPETERVRRLTEELEKSIARAERTGVVDVRDPGQSRWGFLNRK